MAGIGMPAIDVVLMAMKPGGSGPMIWRPSVCQSASAYRIVPVPSVAMKESILRDFDEEAVDQADQRSAGDRRSEWPAATGRRT